MSGRILVASERDGMVRRVTLTRPEVHNALDERTGAEILEAFRVVATDESRRVRLVIVDGAGPSFCAGADIAAMRASLELSAVDNERAALALAEAFEAIAASPVPVVAIAHGAAIGGGVGLLCVADHVIAERGTILGLTETRLGILPAVISPYLVARVGDGAARSLILTGRRVGTDLAERIGLVHEVVDGAEALAAARERITDAVLACGPEANRVAKALLRDLRTLPPELVTAHTARVIAERRVSPEGQEGLRAFLEKRRPGWVPDRP